MRLGLIQKTSDADPDQNLEAIRHGVLHAAAGGARVVVFPEAMMARFGTPLLPLAQTIDGPWASEVSRIAYEHDVLIVAGMFTPGGNNRVRNSLLVTGLGVHLAYNKIHVYDAFGFKESSTVEPGHQLVTADIDGVTIGFATCYDLRFPALFAGLADKGATAVILSASWGAGTGKREQWDVLVRARALDSGCWIVACDQADPAAADVVVDPAAPTGIGYSTVVDGFGRLHGQLGAAPGNLLVDIDAAVAASARAATGVLANRKV